MTYFSIALTQLTKGVKLGQHVLIRHTVIQLGHPAYLTYLNTTLVPLFPYCHIRSF